MLQQALFRAEGDLEYWGGYSFELELAIKAGVDSFDNTTFVNGINRSRGTSYRPRLEEYCTRAG